MSIPFSSVGITPAQCQRFVREFAQRVVGDALLGRAFPARPRTPHGSEYAWWEQALVGAHYTGRPLHRETAPLFTASQIERWCSLLETNLDEAFGEAAAGEAKGHVLNLATMLAHWELSQPAGGLRQGPVAPPALAAA
ncbi:hypothetical protein [Hymenobacter convexus]|uniref:hypothetical protein n=1 Tax=Hymenobacter sp. CA1UV-4 TaxID=3063782 RepID=UPI002712BAD7|nr:hypothetical protein [Hymenobacter sp. CA1UV-4]MDO7852463.1 hypothetical protein [Hymenobacter sp. CA1UV-4]